MAGAGIAGLVACLSEQQQLGGTGAVRVGDEGCLYLVFGHPLHAVAGSMVGPDAVLALGEHAAGTPDCGVSWLDGVTAGRAHSLSPADAILDRLRVLAGETPHGAVGDGPPSFDPMWRIVVSSVCASLESVLHRHAAPFTTVIRAADPEPAAVLEAIGRARALTVRAVSAAQVTSLLDDAEALVRERMIA